MSDDQNYHLDEVDDDLPLSPEAAQATWFAYGGMMVLATLAYFEVLRFTSSFWDQGLYSHGWIVPVMALGLFYMRGDHRGEVPTNLVGGAAIAIGALYALARMFSTTNDALSEQTVILPSWFAPLVVMVLLVVFIYAMRDVKMYHVFTRDRWIGVAIIAACLAMWIFASRIDMNPVNRLSYIGVLLGITLLMGGVRMLKWAGPALGFLIFMFPLPSVVERSVLLFLQKLAAMMSTWVLQLLGMTAMRDGNRIIVDQLPLDVADACSGLRMLTIFGAMSVALAMTIQRPWWDRLCVLLSAVPIALAANVVRIVLTALLLSRFGQDSNFISTLIHDWAGLLMMPVALGLLWLEFEVLSRLSVPVDQDDEFGTADFGAAAG